jgi:hypothetical protein
MRMIFIIVAFLVLITSMVSFSNICFHKYERAWEISRNPYYSKTIDLKKKNVFRWHIDNDDWLYNDGSATLFLVFDRTQNVPGGDLWDREFALKVKVAAYSVTRNNIKDGRLVLNYFSPTDEPMAKSTKLWAGWDDKYMEYFLGNVLRYPKEDIWIELTVLEPDKLLNEYNPHLKIVGDYDPAVLGFVPLIRLIKYGGIVINIVAAAYLMMQAIRQKKETCGRDRHE